MIDGKEYKKKYLNKWFDQFDSNHDGSINFDEANELLPKIEKKLKQSEENLSNHLLNYFKMVDTNSDGLISLEEFSAIVKKKLSEFLKKKNENNFDLI